MVKRHLTLISPSEKSLLHKVSYPVTYHFAKRDHWFEVFYRISTMPRIAYKRIRRRQSKFDFFHSGPVKGNIKYSMVRAWQAFTAQPLQHETLIVA